VKKLSVVSCSAAFVALLSLLYFFLFHFVIHSADEAGPIIIGYEMFHGNPLLSGWTLAASTFYGVDQLVIGALTLVFGMAPKIITLGPAIIWALTVWAAMMIAARQLPRRQRALAMLFVLAVLGIPPIFDNDIILMLARAPIHIGSILYALVLFTLAQRVISSRSSQWVALGAYWITLAVLTLSDPFSPYFGALPVVAMCLTIRSGARKEAFYLVAATVTGVMGGKLAIHFIATAGGFQTAVMPASFAEFSALSKNFSLTVQGLLGLFGSDFFGKPVSPGGDLIRFLASGPIVSVVRLPIAFMVIVVTTTIGVRFFQSTIEGLKEHRFVESDAMRLMLFWTVVIVLLANLVSNMAIDRGTSRYLLPVLVAGSILVAVEFSARRWARPFVIAVLAVSAISVLCGHLTIGKTPRFVSMPQQELAAWLQANQLTDGYGPYWASSIITVITGGTVRTRPLIADAGGNLHPLLFISSVRWFQAPVPTSGKRFILSENSGFEPKVNQDQVILTVGQPVGKYQVGPYTVNVFDASKTDFTKLSLRDSNASEDAAK
jgi:hypothetical protein